MNGFPAVNHGVSNCRKVIESVNTPVQVRHGTPDARLLTEITYAGGFTSYEGGGISYNLPYCKDVPMERTITDWQYVDRLTGYYEELGVSINREPYGPLTGTLVPPCISHAVAIIEALLAAEQRLPPPSRYQSQRRRYSRLLPQSYVEGRQTFFVFA